MKYDCNVARDLMPLVLDGAASGESQTLLNEHLEECADCKAYYAGMQAALPVRTGSEQERKAFDAAARKARKKRRFRLWKRILIGVLIGMAVMYCGLRTWTELTQRYNTLVYHGQYNVFLSQMDDGSVAVNVDFQGSSRNMAVMLEERQEDGRQILYVNIKTTRIPQYMQNPNRNYSCMRLPPGDLDYFAEIREGAPNEYAVVWRSGDSIPAASAEMETYFSLEEQLMAISFQETPDGKLYSLSFEDSQRRDELSIQMEAARKAVPEWQ